MDASQQSVTIIQPRNRNRPPTLERSCARSPSSHHLAVSLRVMLLLTPGRATRNHSARNLPHDSKAPRGTPMLTTSPHTSSCNQPDICHMHAATGEIIRIASSSNVRSFRCNRLRKLREPLPSRAGNWLIFRFEIQSACEAPRVGVVLGRRGRSWQRWQR